jgi:hypothetical protein
MDLPITSFYTKYKGMPINTPKGSKRKIIQINGKKKPLTHNSIKIMFIQNVGARQLIKPTLLSTQEKGLKI